MKIILLDGQRKVNYLLNAFTKSRHKIVVINKDLSFCKHLSRLYPQTIIIHGDGTDESVLQSAQIDDFDLSVHLSWDDKDNLLSAMLLKKAHNVKRTVSLVNEHENEEIFLTLGIDATVDTARSLANIIEQQAFVEHLRSYSPIENGGIAIVNVTIPPNASAIGVKIVDLPLPKETIVSAIFRHEKPLIPHGDTIIEEGDHVIVTTLDKTQAKLVKVLCS